MPRHQKKKKVVRKNSARMTKARMAHSLTKLQKAEVKALVRAPAETKYRGMLATVYDAAGNLPASAYGVKNSIISGGVNQQIWQLIPLVTEGLTGCERIGNKISNVTLKSDWFFYINPNIAMYPSIDATVKVFILRAKQARAGAALQTVPVGSLLDAGDGTSIDWTATATANDSTLLSQYPVNKEVFSVLKIHKFRLCKNPDSPTGGTGGVSSSSPNLTAHQTKEFSHSLKHSGALVYPDNNLTGYALPTNLTYFAFVVAYDTNSFQPLPASTILANVRAHMWFKDM